jgi:HAD superfamily hydrolase (TIGR01490 family)|tara:strand:+ start:246 stop:899 length:654 start_codon:yes stop_codon:yes gene_type:complete
MALAIFDLDNTLLGGDSDYLWGEFLVEHNYVVGEYHQKMNELFYQQYLAGTMDMAEFLAFQLKPLADNDIAKLHRWRETYLSQKIAPIILPAARELIKNHQQAGDTLLIITATNDFITAPIAEQLDIAHLIATEAEMIDGQYTGKVTGTASYQEGKVIRLNEWLAEQHISLKGSYFYSDSHNDLPLLKRVDHPVAVDPDDTLRQFAEQQGWKVVSLR